MYVGYKSNPQAIPDVQGGLLTFMMIDTVNAKIAIDRGALKGLLLTDTERYPRCPTSRRRPKPACPMCCSRPGPATMPPRARRARSSTRSTPTSAPWRPSRRCWPGWTRMGGTPKLMSPDEFGAFTVPRRKAGQDHPPANIRLE